MQSRILVFIAAICCTFVVVSCTVPAPSGSSPAWIDNPKSADSIYMYQVGTSSGAGSSDQARKLAYEDALASISKSVLSDVSVQGGTTTLASTLQIRDAEIMSGCEHTIRTLTGYTSWVQVSYPLAEKNKLSARIDKGVQINKLWGSARSDVHRGAYDNAMTSLKTIINEYEEAMGQDFAIEDAKITLGNVYAERKNFAEARRWYENVLKISNSRQWKDKARTKISRLPQAPRMQAMADRFSGRKLAVLPCIRTAKQCARSRELAAVLAKDCREAGIGYIDISKDMTPAGMADVFDEGKTSAVWDSAEKAGAGVVLAVLMDIDPTKRGKTVQIFGTPTPAVDTQVRFLVIASEKTIYSGSFKETAGNSSNDRLAGHAGTVLIRNYLVPKCPRIK